MGNFWELLNKAQTYYYTKKVWKINISFLLVRMTQSPRIPGLSGLY